MTLKEEIYKVVAKIPEGKVMTYKQVAIFAGNPKASRAVGYAMRTNPDMVTVPCHRVVGSNGKLVGYSARNGISSKREMLMAEGVVFKDENTVNLEVSQL